MVISFTHLLSLRKTERSLLHLYLQRIQCTTLFPCASVKEISCIFKTRIMSWKYSTFFTIWTSWKLRIHACSICPLENINCHLLSPQHWCSSSVLSCSRIVLPLELYFVWTLSSLHQNFKHVVRFRTHCNWWRICAIDVRKVAFKSTHLALHPLLTGCELH